MRAVAVLLVLASPLAAQSSERLSASAFVEQYRFGDGYVVRRLSELTIPVAVNVALGRRASMVLSTGHVSVDLESADPAQIADQRLSGPLDTDVRLNWDVMSGRMVAFLAGVLPTGRQSVVADDLGVLVALTNDAIGFAAPSLGSGGSLGAGLSAAFPAGRLALGAAATAFYAFPYQPVAGEPVKLKPGAEVRGRVGLEGPLARRTYLRLAGSVAVRQQDELDGAVTHGLGNRFIGYVTIEQGLGPTLLSLYAFDVFRGSPQLEPTALGAAILPRGNLVAGGGTLTVALGRTTTLVPRAEYRIATAALDPESGRLVRQAASLRAGTDLRQRVGRGATLVLRGDGVWGDVRQGPDVFDFTGFRGAVQLEITP
jgi:hypothetical protein